MTLRTFVAPAIALALALGVPAQAKPEASPAQKVISALVISGCAMDQGLSFEMGKKLFDKGVSGLDPQTVKNVMANPLFGQWCVSLVKKSGGCASIHELIGKHMVKTVQPHGI